MHINDRVRNYRDRLRDKDHRRLEVWLGAIVIENVRQIARYTGRPVQAVVQDALTVYIEEYRLLDFEYQRLTDERTRLQAEVDAPWSRDEIRKFDLQAAAYNERLAKFSRTAVTSP